MGTISAGDSRSTLTAGALHFMQFTSRTLGDVECCQRADIVHSSPGMGPSVPLHPLCIWPRYDLNAFLEQIPLLIQKSIRNLSNAIRRCLNLRPVFDLFSFHFGNLFAAGFLAKYLIDAHIFRESKRRAPAEISINICNKYTKEPAKFQLAIIPVEL